MAETETCEGRIQFFHRYCTHSYLLVQCTVLTLESFCPLRSTGIIRDVMANHLQLLLGIAVAPSFSELIPSHADHERLAFAQSLARTEAESELLLGQYDEYALHYMQETGQDLPSESSLASPFVPTAALVSLQSSAIHWEDTQFVLSAVKAAQERRLELLIHFKAPKETGDQDSNGSCLLHVTIQTRKNAERRTSERIEWTCAFLDGLVTPSGWELDNRDQRVMVPTSSTDEKMWQRGDERTAYDVLLREATTGDRKHFASMQEAVAAWELWTPIVQHAERATLRGLSPPSQSQDSQAVPPRASYVIYSTGSTPWASAQATAVTGHTPRDEL